MIALGVVNPCGAMLPDTERGTITAVITEPAIRPPRIGAVVPVAVTTTCNAWLPVSATTAE